MARLLSGIDPILTGGNELQDNGNGSLMRILPLAFYLLDKNIEERYELTKQVSSITHRHNISVIGCFYYLEFAISLIKGLDKYQAYQSLHTKIPAYLKSVGLSEEELFLYNRLFNSDISLKKVDEIQSSGYVVHTLEASIWCILRTDNYKDAVLLAVNLGDDTDTTACVTGGLAGIIYGPDGIPNSWRKTLLKRHDIEDLATRLYNNLI